MEIIRLIISQKKRKLTANTWLYSNGWNIIFENNYIWSVGHTEGKLRISRGELVRCSFKKQCCNAGNDPETCSSELSILRKKMSTLSEHKYWKWDGWIYLVFQQIYIAHLLWTRPRKLNVKHKNISDPKNT